MSNIKLINKPTFWDPKKVTQWFEPDIEAVMREGRSLGLTPASERPEQNMLILIDDQWDFTEKGRLPVQGMFEDVRRLCERIIESVYSAGYYTQFMISLDCHPPIVIHGSPWWCDETGNPPDVTLPVMMKLVDPDTAAFEAIFISGESSRIFYPVFDRKGTVEYAQHLKATNQNNGLIWVFTSHCKVGTDGIALVPALAEVIYWAAAALEIDPIFITKGMIADRDWLGPFQPCMEKKGHPQGGLQISSLNEILKYNRVDIAGETKDFCVESGTRQIMEYFGNQPAVLKRIRFINDCTSSIVPDSPAIAKFEADMKDSGISLINHTQF
jgi:nicotinamidase-related amidase